MTLGDLLIKQGPLIRVPKDQQSSQGPGETAFRDFITRYLGCFGLSPSDLDKLPKVLREGGVGGDIIKCIVEVMKSSSWEEAFTKINLEAALLEVASRHELQRLSTSKQTIDPLSLWSLYNFIASISAIRMLINNDATRPIGLATLAKATYLLFDLLMELAKRKATPSNLEVEFWRAREALVEAMEELFKGNGMMTVNDKPFDKGK
jgi:hypothetical protein